MDDEIALFSFKNLLESIKVRNISLSYQKIPQIILKIRKYQQY